MNLVRNRAKAYSYLRFSTPDQLKGDSLRRQTQAARDYAERNGLDLDESLSFRDLGVSAFRGKNAVEGALGAFIEAVDSGRVEPGSYLLIESLDRLSRDRIMPALNRFADLLGKGIRIVTLSDRQVYDSESINNLTGLIVPLVSMARANEESEMKSKRLRAAWKQKKVEAANGKHVLTGRVPAWLRVRDGSLEAIRERAAIVRRIFEMADSGHGKAAIARALNTENVPPFGRAKGWHPSYIQKILRNAAVIGRYQPMRNVYEDGRRKRVTDGEPVDGYFPAVIDESLFYSVKHSKPGPSGKGDSLQRNLLSGIVFCARCGGSMHYVNKGGGYQYLACDNSRRIGNCDALSVRYFATFANVMAELEDWRTYEPDGAVVQKRDRELDAIGGQIVETQEAIERLADTLERVQSQAVEERLASLETKLTTLKAKRDDLKEKAVVASNPRRIELDLLDDPIAEYIIFEGDREVPKDKVEAVRAGRAHIAAEIRRSVKRVEVEKGKPVKVIPRSDH